MPAGLYREEVLNVHLAILLHQREIVTAPEQSLWQAVHKARHVPDVMVVYRGLRTVIEGKVADVAAAKGKAFADAQQRVEKGIAHIGVAVVYPRKLRKASFPDLLDDLARSQLDINAVSEAGEMGWSQGGVDYLADLLRRTFDQLIKEDIVTRVTEILDGGVTEFSRHAFTSPAQVKTAAEILGVGVPPPRRSRKKQEVEE